MTETPLYSVIKKQKEIELRQYAGYIQAEVSVVEKDYKSAIERGFGVLAISLAIMSPEKKLR
jgi:hypothetical protein